MTYLERRFLGIAACLSLLAGAAGCAKRVAPTGNPVAILLTVDSSNHVAVDKPHVTLHYKLNPNPDFADWQIKPGTNPFVFAIKFNKYTSGPPPEHLPDPSCQGQNMGYHCSSVLAAEHYKGTHPYSIVVNGVVTDPDVTIDP